MSKASEGKPENNNIVKVKLVVLGKSLVGKTALAFRFISDKFPTEHDTTVEDQYKVNLTIEDINCELEILDTAGQEDYQTMFDSWIESGNCYLLVYSIDDEESFNQVKVKYEITARRPGDIDACFADPNYAYQQLGWKAELGIKEMCKDAYNFVNKN